MNITYQNFVRIKMKKRIEIISLMIGLFAIVACESSTVNLRSLDSNLVQDQDQQAGIAVDGPACTYDDQVVEPGASLTREGFQLELSTYGEACVSEPQTGICTGGNMVWDGSFENSACVQQDFALIEVGMTSTCALDARGKAYCWGQGDAGQLGNDSEEIKTVPEPVSGDLVFASLTGGLFFHCGLTAEGAAYCWGRNTLGQLGDGTNTNRLIPVPVSGGLVFKQINAMYEHVCGVTNNNTAYCWGDNRAGQIGDGTIDGTDAGNNSKRVPTLVSGDNTFVAIAAGDVTSCALNAVGQAFCWGDGGLGALGNGAEVNSLVPTAVAGNHSYSQISAGTSAACGLKADDTAYCWGFGSVQLDGDDPTVPTLVAGNHKFKTISLGLNHRCGTTVDGNGLCWGNPLFGALGNGDITNYQRIPSAVLDITNFANISGGSSHSCGLTEDGQAYCWGWGERGQRGDGTMIDSAQPVAVK